MRISIPKPCSASWNKMHPNTQGRFCDLCSKTVVDFSNKSTQEIEQYFKENSNEKTCGRFRTDQLKSNVSNLEKILKKFCVTSILFLLPVNALQAQSEKEFVFVKDTCNAQIDPPKPLNMIKVETIGVVDSSQDSVGVDEIEEEVQLMGDIAIEMEKGDMIEPYMYFKVDEKPVFPGGQEALFNTIKSKIGNGPFPAEEKIYLSFVIDALGKVENPKVVRGNNKELIKRSIEILNNLPHWQPACHNDIPVAVKYTIPILFINQNY
ncbi:MAG: energy transducer TonB [Flavobacteriales bacterium]